MTVQLAQPTGVSRRDAPFHRPGEPVAFPDEEGSMVRISLVGARSAVPTPGATLPGVVHDYSGQDPGSWRTHGPLHDSVRFASVYPGIDVVYYGDPVRVEFDFIVAPGADPSIVALALQGDAAKVRPDGSGGLIVDVAGRELRMERPRIYQEGAGGRSAVDGRFVLDGNGHARFDVGTYDRRRTLVIDPVLSASTTLGGPHGEFGADVRVDSTGNIHVVGATGSPGFLTGSPQPFAGSTDAFVMKFDPSGTTLLYATYLGGSSMDAALGVAIDGGGRAMVAGATRSPNLPLPLANAYDTTYNGGPGGDGFAARLKQDGTLDYVTYIGGSEDDTAYGITPSGFVVGSTTSSRFLTLPARAHGGSRDAFVLRLTHDGTGITGTRSYLGGGNVEDGFAVVDTGSGAAFTGQSCSDDLGATVAVHQSFHAGGCDAFVAEIIVPNNLWYVTYLGGSRWDLARKIARHGGRLFVTGETASFGSPAGGLPTTLGALQPNHAGGVYDAFVADLDQLKPGPEEARMLTYLGGTKDDFGSGIDVDLIGNVHVTGATVSPDFPRLNPLPQGNAYAGGSFLGDAFVTKFTPGGLLAYSTLLGGPGEDGASAIDVTDDGTAVVTGTTDSSAFPKQSPYQPAHGGMQDAFLAVIAVPTCTTPGVGPHAYVAYSGTNLRIVDTSNRCIVGTLDVGEDPGAIATSADGTRAYVANRIDGTVSVITRNPSTGAHAVTETVQVGGSPQAIAVRPDGMRVYVANRLDDTVSVLAFDPATTSHSAVALINLQQPPPVEDAGPHGMSVHPTGRWVYTADLNVDYVSVIDTATNQKVSDVLVGDQPYTVVAHPGGERVYVTNKADQSISVLSVDDTTGALTLVDTIPSSQAPAFNNLAIDDDGSRIFVPIDFPQLRTTVLDGHAHTTISTFARGAVDGGGAGVTRDGKHLYLVASGHLAIVDAGSGDVVDTIYGHHKANGPFIAPADRDGDGILDPIDGAIDAAGTFVGEPLTSGVNFTDVHRGGTVSGRIIDRDGLSVLLWDAAAPGGVFARAIGGAGTATVQACGYDVLLDAGDVTNLLECASLSLSTIAGRADVALSEDATLQVPEHGSVRVSEPEPRRFVVENRGEVAVQVVDSTGTTRRTIDPGGTSTVSAARAAPIARRDTYHTDEDALLIVPAPGVLANDSDDGQIVGVALESGGLGSASVEPDGGLTYMPPPDWNGTDELTYRVTDDENLSSVGTIEVVVAPVNDGPQAADDAATVEQYSEVLVPVTDNDTDADGDSLAVVSVSEPSAGDARILSGGRVSYRPDYRFKRSDTFTYTVSDGRSTASASVTVTEDGCGEDGPASGPVDHEVEPIIGATAGTATAAAIHSMNCAAVVSLETLLTLGRRALLADPGPTAITGSTAPGG